MTPFPVERQKKEAFASPAYVIRRPFFLPASCRFIIFLVRRQLDTLLCRHKIALGLLIFHSLSAREMGNDGGSIPTRRELVKSSAAALSTTQVKEIQSEQQEHYWSTCALSHRSLSLPVYSDALGTLYNKDAVLNYLVNVGNNGREVAKEEFERRGEAFKDRLRGLRDVIEVRFQTEGLRTSQRWVCPVSGKPLGPGTRAVYLVPCGHAFAETVFKEMPGSACLQV